MTKIMPVPRHLILLSYQQRPLIVLFLCPEGGAERGTGWY